MVILQNCGRVGRALDVSWFSIVTICPLSILSLNTCVLSQVGKQAVFFLSPISPSRASPSSTGLSLNLLSFLPRPILSQFLSLKIYRTTFLNYLKFPDILILKLQNSGRDGRVPLFLLLLPCSVSDSVFIGI